MSAQPVLFKMSFLLHDPGRKAGSLFLAAIGALVCSLPLPADGKVCSYNHTPSTTAHVFHRIVELVTLGKTFKIMEFNQ